MKSFHLIFIMSFLVGCASAWTIRQTPNGGTVGYKGGGILSSADSLNRKIKEQIVCPESYVVVADELNSSSYAYTTYQPVTTYGSGVVKSSHGSRYNYNSQQTTNVPVQNVGTDYWSELTYLCVNVEQAEPEAAREVAASYCPATTSLKQASIRGCCSHHGGVAGPKGGKACCGEDRKVTCNDGTKSPSCTCQ